MKKFYETPDAVVISLNIRESVMDAMDVVDEEDLENGEPGFNPGTTTSLYDD